MGSGTTDQSTTIAGNLQTVDRLTPFLSRRFYIRGTVIQHTMHSGHGIVTQNQVMLAPLSAWIPARSLTYSANPTSFGLTGNFSVHPQKPGPPFVGNALWKSRISTAVEGHRPSPVNLDYPWFNVFQISMRWGWSEEERDVGPVALVFLMSFTQGSQEAADHFFWLRLLMRKRD